MLYSLCIAVFGEGLGPAAAAALCLPALPAWPWHGLVAPVLPAVPALAHQPYAPNHTHPCGAAQACSCLCRCGASSSWSTSYRTPPVPPQVRACVRHHAGQLLTWQPCCVWVAEGPGPLRACAPAQPSGSCCPDVPLLHAPSRPAHCSIPVSPGLMINSFFTKEGVETAARQIRCMFKWFCGALGWAAGLGGVGAAPPAAPLRLPRLLLHVPRVAARPRPPSPPVAPSPARFIPPSPHSSSVLHLRLLEVVLHRQRRLRHRHRRLWLLPHLWPPGLRLVRCRVHIPGGAGSAAAAPQAP